MENLLCSTCGEIKDLNLFQKNGWKSNGEQYYRPDCEECRKPIIKEEGKTHRQSIRKELKQI